MLRRKKSSKSYYQRKFERELRKALKESKAEAENANQELNDNNDLNNSGDTQFVEKQFQQDEQNDQLHQIEKSDQSINDEENFQSQQYENSDQFQNNEENAQSKQSENDDIIQMNEENDQFQQVENIDQYQNDEENAQSRQYENSDQFQNDEENNQSQQYENSDQYQNDEESNQSQQYEKNDQLQSDEENNQSQQFENSDQYQNDEESNQSQQYENSDQLQNYEENAQSQLSENDNIIQNDEESAQSQQYENSDQFQNDEENNQSQQFENSDQYQNDEESNQSQQYEKNDQLQNYEENAQSQLSENDNIIQKDEDDDGHTQQNNDSYKFQQIESSDFTQKLENKEESQEYENSNEIRESNTIKPTIEVEQNQNLISNKPDLIPTYNSSSLPLLVLEPQSEQKNESSLKKDSFNNPFFVEFEIEAPNPNSSNVFINKKYSSPQLPILTNSSFSSTTSSATSSDDDTSHHKKQKEKSIKTPTKNLLQNFQLNQPQNRFQQLKQQSESRQQIWQPPKHQEQNNDDEYFGVINDDDYSEYNDVEIDDEDDITNNSQFNTTIYQKNDKFINQYPGSLNYSTKSNERQNIQYKQFTLQPPPPQRQGIVSFSKINDPMLISAFSYLDEFDEKKKIEYEKNRKKSRKYELTHKGLPFYTYDSNKNNKREYLFPTDPIKPNPKMIPQMNMMIGLCNDLNQDGQTFSNFEFDNALDFRPEFESVLENDSLFKQKNDHEMAKSGQNTQKSYTFEIAPYLTRQNQKQQQTYTEPTIKNIAETNDNDNQIHTSNFAKESEINENIGLNQANNKGNSRYYQQNDYFGTDDDYDIDFIDNLNSGISKNNEAKLINSKHQSKKYENPFYETIAKLGRPISKEIDIASFPTIPFRPMNSEDMYSLMMNSMICNDKMFK